MRLACACKCQCRCECGYCSEWGCERVVCVCLKQVAYRCCIAEPALFSNNAAAAAQSSATLTHDILHSRNLHQQHARRKPGWRYQLTGTWQSTMGTSPAASRAAMALRALALRGGLHAALADDLKQLGICNVAPRLTVVCPLQHPDYADLRKACTRAKCDLAFVHAYRQSLDSCGVYRESAHGPGFLQHAASAPHPSHQEESTAGFVTIQRSSNV